MKTKLTLTASAVFLALIAFMTMGAITTGPITTGTVTNVLNGVYIPTAGGLGTNTTIAGTFTTTGTDIVLTNSVGPTVVVRGNNSAIHTFDWRFNGENYFANFVIRTENLWTATNSQNAISIRDDGIFKIYKGSTNLGWSYTTGKSTNRSDQWIIGSNDNIYTMYDTPAGDVFGAGAKWTRGGAVKWWIVNQDSTSTEDLTVLNQTTAEVARFKTNGTFVAANQFNIGSYNYSYSTNVQTTDANATILASGPVASGSCVTVVAEVAADQSTGANGASFVRMAGGRNASGTTAIIGSQATSLTATNVGLVDCNITFDDTTDTWRVQVTGKASTTYNWRGKVSVTTAP